MVCNDKDGNLLAHQQLQLLEHGQALVKVGLVLLPLGQTGHLLIGVADGPHGVGIGAGELGDIGEEGAHVGGGIVAPAAVAHQGELIGALVDVIIPGSGVIGGDGHGHSRLGEAVFDNLCNGQVVGAIAAEKGDRQILTAQHLLGLLGVIVVLLHHMFVVEDTSLGDIARAAHGTRPTEHVVHDTLAVDGSVYRLAVGEV